MGKPIVLTYALIIIFAFFKINMIYDFFENFLEIPCLILYRFPGERDHLAFGIIAKTAYYKEEDSMGEDKRVKDILIPIEKYETVSIESKLCDALAILKRNYEKIKKSGQGELHTTIFIKDNSGKIVGKISMYDLIKGLVPESVKGPEMSRAYYSVLSSRILEVTKEVGEVQARFKWLHSSFMELIKQEAQKPIRDVMSQVHPLLTEDDTINHAIYIIFKEDVRQPLVVKDGEVIGVVTLKAIFDEMIELLGPECGVNWEM